MIYIILGILVIWGVISTGVFIGITKQLDRQGKMRFISGGELFALVMISILFPVGIHAICTSNDKEEEEK